MQVIVIPLTEKGEQILKSNTDKFGLGKYKTVMLRKAGDLYTVTEILDHPFRIITSIKPEFEKYLNDKVLFDKVNIAVQKIMLDHGGSLKDVSVEVSNE